MPAKSIPIATYTYADARGIPVLIVKRFHDADPARPEGYKKRFTQSTKDETGAWVGKNPRKNPDGTPRLNPLYGLPMIVESLDAPVLVVQDEKAYHGALDIAPPGWIVTTWAGGSSAVKHTDWAPLQGRRVAIWPDNDTAGTQAAHAVAAALQGAPIVALPDGLPLAWDLGDPLSEAALTPEMVSDLILTARAPDAPAHGKHATPEELNGHLNGHDVIKQAIPHFVALGHVEMTKFYFFSGRTMEIVSFSSRDLRSGNAPRDLVPDENFWARRISTKSGVDWKAIGDDLINECYNAKRYNPSKVRARGVWLDPSLAAPGSFTPAVVAHLGDVLLIDGQPTPPILAQSKYVYPADDALLPAAPADIEALTDAEGSTLISACRLPSWANKISGDLLAGLIATSTICGALDWRTHGWLTGPRGCGKSYLMKHLVARALEGVALNVLASSTEPGIRRRLCLDARPVIFDEAEGEGKEGEARRKMLIQYMRAASSQTDAEVLKGSGGPRGEAFRIAAQFILGSVNVSISRATDETRTLILTLRSRETADAATRRDYVNHFADIQSALAALPEHLSARLLKRMLSMVHVVRESAATIRRLIATEFADARIGDQLGTVLAGTYALRHSGPISETVARAYLAKFDWDEYTTRATADDQDEGFLFNHLAGQRVRVETDQSVVERTVGELCAIASGALFDTIGAATANRALARCGMHYQDHVFWIARNHPTLDQFFSRSQFPEGYQRIIARVLGAIKSTIPRRFAGVSTRYITIPEKYLVTREYAAREAVNGDLI